MDYQHHLLTGFLVGIVFIMLTHSFLGWFEVSLFSFLLFSFVIFIYSLLPDLDHPLSNITWLFIFVSLSILILGVSLKEDFYFYSGTGILLFTFICSKLFKHRGFIHSIFAGLIFSIPLYHFGIEFSLLGVVCYYSHLALDGFYFKVF